MSEKAVVVIPARGGSKRIPKKNLVVLAGRPLIAYAINAALESCAHETWVSSDDVEILGVAESYGASGIKRPEEFATDTATSESVLLHCAEHVDFDIVVLLQATSPLVRAADINRGIALMADFDTVISVSQVDQFVWVDGKPSYDVVQRPRTQDYHNPYMLETGAFFIMRKEGLLKYKNRIYGNVGFCEVPRRRSFDIDTFEDLQLVERLLS